MLLGSGFGNETKGRTLQLGTYNSLYSNLLMQFIYYAFFTQVFFPYYGYGASLRRVEAACETTVSILETRFFHFTAKGLQ